MKLFTIARKDVLLLLRDRKALLTLVGTPLILTFILGTAFANMWSSEIPPSRILWRNGDPGGYGDILLNDVLALPGIAEWVILEEVTERSPALERVRNGQATAFIEIPPDFSRAVEAGEGVITVAGDPTSSIRANTITRIVQAFSVELSSRRLIHQGLAGYQLALPPRDVETALAAVRLEARLEDGFLPDATRRDTVLPMDYYAAGMGVMYLLFTASHGATTFLRERETRTLARMYQSPAQSWEIAAGKFTGIFLTACLQLAAVICFSALVYRVFWGNLLGVIALTASAAFAASGIGVLIAAVSRSHSAANALGTAIVLPMAVLGGSMQPLFAMPPLLRTLSRATVNGWALDGYVRLMFEGAGLADLLVNLGVLAAMGVVFMALASHLLAQKGVAA